jgi:hypothetical protein
MAAQEIKSWDERQLELLRPKYPAWELWAVRTIYPKPFTTWCARPVGHPVATINADSPERLIEEIRQQEQDALQSPE